jgi:hypothetical protein
MVSEMTEREKIGFSGGNNRSNIRKNSESSPKM